MSAFRAVLLVLHLEHDGDDLDAVLIHLSEDVITLGAVRDLVVLLEIGVGEGRGTDAVERDLAMLLEGLAEHLRGKLGLHVTQLADLGILVRDDVVLGPELLGHLDAHLAQHTLTLGLDELDLRHRVIALLGNLDRGLRDGKGLLGVEPLHLRVELVPQLRDLRILLAECLTGSRLGIGKGELEVLLVVVAQDALTLGKVMLELLVPHLPRDIGISRLIDLEDLAAVRASDLTHNVSSEGPIVPSNIRDPSRSWRPSRA